MSGTKSGMTGDAVGGSTNGGARGRFGSAWMVAAAALASLLLPACTMPPEGLPVVKGVEQPDIPVKRGFQLFDSEAYDAPVPVDGKFRSWVGFYHGRGNLQDIGPWYVEAMQEHGWTFAGRIEQTGPEFTYNFFKGDEAATIHVAQRYRPLVKEVRAEIHPRGTESMSPSEIDSLRLSSGRPATGTISPAVEPADDDIDIDGIDDGDLTTELPVELPLIDETGGEAGK